MTWVRCDFQPLDVVMNADARPLDMGGYGHEGEIAPHAFAGALRTAVLRKAGYRFSRKRSEPDQSKEALEAADRVGLGGKPEDFSFRFMGPVFRTATTGEPVFPLPRDRLVDKKGQPAGSLSMPQGEVSGELSNLDEGMFIPGSSTGATPSSRFGSMASICRYLGARAETHVEQGKKDSRLQNEFERFSSSVRHGHDLRESDILFRERRHGHSRNDRNVVQKGALYSRASLRFVQEALMSGAGTAGYIGWLKGVDERFRPDGSLTRLGSDGHVVRLSLDATRDDFAPARELLRLVEAFISVTRKFSIYLASPAVFGGGWKPSLDGIPGIRLRAASVGRPIVVAGWDMVSRGPKPIRRAVPAGSIYFYDIDDGQDPGAVFHELKKYHLDESLSEESGRLGYGYTLLGLW